MNLKQNDIFAGRYRLIKKIGRGGFSVVWLVADQMAEDTQMALKIYAPDKGMDEGGLKMFRKEYAITANLNHPGLLKASHFDIHEGSPYLLMPYCNRGSLHSLLMEKGQFSEKEIVKVLCQMADALTYLHKKEVVHQDIKPDNVLIDSDGNYLLTDFGISSRLRTTLRKSTTTGKSLTVAYAPPERFSGSTKSYPASDVFSLGVMLFEMATRDVPWMGAGGAVLRPNSQPLELPDGYSKGLEQLMLACLSYDPTQRPTAGQLKQFTEQYLQTDQWPVHVKTQKESSRKTDQKPESGRETKRIEPEPSKKPDKTVPILLALLALILLAGGGYGWWSNEQEKASLVCAKNFKQAEEYLKAEEFHQALSAYRHAKDCCTDNCTVARAGEKAVLNILRDRYDALLTQGDALLEQGKYEEARARYTEAGQWQPEGKKPEKKLAEVKERKAELDRQKAEAERKKREEQERIVLKLINEMVEVQGGTFTMGCTSEQSDCISEAIPAHRVTLSSFSIGKYEITQAQWRAIMGADPLTLYNKSCDQCPVERVSWQDIVNKFLPKLNRVTGMRFRLPTEAEWEYAARGGNKSKGYKYAGSNSIGSVAWYDNNAKSGNTHGSQKTTRPVGQKSPNELGLYDMSGNVWEWCSDWYDGDYYENSPRNNPKGPSSGLDRVLRGGSWYGIAEYCRVAYRDSNHPRNRNFNNGFRLVLSQ